MSEGLFTFFEPTSTGVFYMDWYFDGEGPAAPPQQPATTSTPPPPPPPTTSTPAWTPDPTTSVPPPPPTTTSTEQAYSEQAVSTPAPDAGNSNGSGVVAAANMAAVQIANMLYVAKGV